MNELLEKSKLGDVEAFSELIKLVSKDLKKIVIRRILDQSYVDDVLQSIFYQAYIKLPTIENNDSFRYWIFKIAENKCKNFNRDMARHKELSLTGFEDFFEDTSSYDPEADINFEQMISNLTEEEKNLLRMKYQENFSNTEIAEELGIPYNTVKSKIRRAITKIMLALLVLIVVSGFTVLATFIIKQIRAHFTTSLNAINTAVENNYVQEIDNDFVYDNGIGIKVDAIVLDDKNLDISFVYDVQDKEKYGEITGIGLNEYIVNADDKLLFDSKNDEKQLSNYINQYQEKTEMIYETYRNSILLSAIEEFPITNNLSIEIKSILINTDKEDIYIKGDWILEHNVIGKLNERSQIKYIMENNSYVKKAEVVLNDTSLQFILDMNIEDKIDDLEDIILYNSYVYSNCTNFIFYESNKRLEVSFDIGKYTSNIEELVLEIPRKNHDNIIIKFRRNL